MVDNYSKYLATLRMVGVINSSPLITALLVTVDIAYEECLASFNVTMTKPAFIKKLRSEGVGVFSSIDEFNKLRDSLKGRTKHKVER